MARSDCFSLQLSIHRTTIHAPSRPAFFHPRFRLLLLPLFLKAVILGFHLIIELLLLPILDALPNPSFLLARFAFRALPNCLALSKAVARYNCNTQKHHENSPDGR
jgi:hypothetical protein